MNLENYTTDELREELKRRETVFTDPRSHKMYIGIIDCHGAESLMLADTIDQFRAVMSSLELRAKFNGQRDPEIFSVRMPVDLFSILNEKLKNGYEGDFVEVANVLKGLSTYKKIG